MEGFLVLGQIIFDIAVVFYFVSRGSSGSVEGFSGRVDRLLRIK